MEWVVLGLGLLTFLGFGAQVVLIKKPLEKTPPIALNVARNAFTVLFLAIVLFATGIPPLAFDDTLVFGILLALFGYLPLMFFLKALSKGKIGVVVPLANTSAVFTAILAATVLHEPLSTHQTIALALVILGILLSTLDLRQLRESAIFTLTSGILFAILASALWGIQFFLFKFQVTAWGVVWTALITELGGLVGSLVHSRIRHQPLRPMVRADILLPVALASLVVSIGALSYNAGIDIAPVSVMAGFFAASPLIAIAYGKIALGERTTPSQSLGIASSMAGVIALALL